MSASERLRRIVNGAPWLWIDTPMRAAAAAVAAIIVLGSLIAIERSEPWRALGKAAPKASATVETRLVAALAWSSTLSVETVIMVGGSTTREFSATDARVSRLLTARCGRPIHFINAGTSSQTFAESWMLSEATPERTRRLVIVGMNYNRFEESAPEVARSWQSSLFPFDPSASLERVIAGGDQSLRHAEALPRQTSWLLRRLDQVTLTTRPMSFEAFARSEGPTPWEGPLNLYRGPALDRGQKDAIVQQMVAERLPVFMARHSGALRLWQAFIERFDSEASDVLFLALPESEALAPMRRRADKPFVQDLAMLEANGAHVADWRTGHGLTDVDFYDQQHLLESGRRALEPRFIDLVADSLPGCA